jgi:hypothetical protein
VLTVVFDTLVLSDLGIVALHIERPHIVNARSAT